MAKDEFKLPPNPTEDGEEPQEQLNSVMKNLMDLGGDGTSMVTFSKQDMSLMKQILTAATEEYKEQIMWRMCDFVDDDEAKDHVAAFYEAKDLGMDTGFNVAFMFSLVSANRKTNKSNLMSQFLQTMVGKWEGNKNKGWRDRGNGHSSNSPIG